MKIERSKTVFLMFILTGMVMSIAIPVFSVQETGQKKDADKDPALTATCTADPASIAQGAEDPVVTITCNIEQKEEHPLTYTWSVTGGAKVIGSDAVVTIDTTGLRPGLYIAKVKIDDNKKNTVTSRAPFNVTPGVPTNKCPTLSITATPQTVEQGANSIVTLRLNASQQGLKYKWTTDKGEIKGDGETVTLDTASLEPGTITVSVSVTDEKCPQTVSATITKK